MTGLLIAAPASSCGKTTVTLGLLRALSRAGVPVAPFKVGPDYIDPAFHTAACGRACFNLDSWAMRRETLACLIERAVQGVDLSIGEGAMGLFDGAPDGKGSTADLARLTGWPVVLIVDVQGQAASAAAVVHGFATWDRDITLAGVIFNRTGGDRHAALLWQSCEATGIPVLGCLPRRSDIALPDRHLGLVQAGEHPDLEAFLDRAAEFVSTHVDIKALTALARPSHLVRCQEGLGGIRPLGQRLAVARDTAFAFAYPYLLDHWHQQGAEILFFSPLADEAPDPSADAIYLPGGYPELHAGTLAAAGQFRSAITQAAAKGVPVYGECGGYMVLGQGLIDAAGERHPMLGLLPVETSFAVRRMHLGYREATLIADCPLATAGTTFRGHEFHFASITSADEGEAPLWRLRDASGEDRGFCGGRSGSVFGSFVHLMDGV